jgi:hypothetical protein
MKKTKNKKTRLVGYIDFTMSVGHKMIVKSKGVPRAYGKVHPYS